MRRERTPTEIPEALDEGRQDRCHSWSAVSTEPLPQKPAHPEELRAGQSDALRRAKATRKAKAKTTPKRLSFFAGFCLGCKAWGHMRRIAGETNPPRAGRTLHLWKVRAKQPVNWTPRSLECCCNPTAGCTAVDPTKWMFSVTNRESRRSWDVSVPAGFV